MKRLTLATTDNQELHFVPESHILEVAENQDGTTDVAFVAVITTKSSVEEIRNGLSRNRIPKIKWLKQSPQP